MKEKKYMSRQGHKKVIISGGGTGGHIFPAISIANALKRIDPGTEILFVGADGRMEMEKIPAAGYEIVGLPVAGLSRSFTLKNLVVLFKLIKSLTMARQVIRRFKPDVVVGVGPLSRSKTAMPASQTSCWQKELRLYVLRMMEWTDISRLKK
jgi:UDP-N-acetylglucosamine--N-acetylmuramyl-(pentapeptide) pyrophosphoryl-undecaprenol N-acetylglucosamine transferase